MLVRAPYRGLVLKSFSAKVQVPTVPPRETRRQLHTLAVEPLAGQLNESPQAHEPVALGLSMVKPCFSMVSTKSMDAPST